MAEREQLTEHEHAMLSALQAGVWEYIKTEEEWAHYGRPVTPDDRGMLIETIHYVTAEEAPGIKDAIEASISRGEAYTIPGSGITFSPADNGGISVSTGNAAHKDNLRPGLALENYIEKNIIGVVSTGKQETVFYDYNTVNRNCGRVPVLRIKDEKDFSAQQLIMTPDGTPFRDEDGYYRVLNSEDRMARFQPEERERLEGEEAELLHAALLNVCSEKGITVSAGGAENGDGTASTGRYDPAKNEIVINDDAISSRAAECSALLRGMACADMYGGDAEASGPQDTDAGISADCVQYMTSQAFGLGVTLETGVMARLAEGEVRNGTVLLSIERGIRDIAAETDRLMNEAGAELEALRDGKERVPAALSDERIKAEAESCRSYVRGLKKDNESLSGISGVDSEEFKDLSAQVNESLRNADNEIARMRGIRTGAELKAARDRIGAQLDRANDGINQKRDILMRESAIMLEKLGRAPDISASTQFVINPGRYLDALSERNDTVSGLYTAQREYLSQSAYARTTAHVLDETGEDAFAAKIAEQAGQIGRMADGNGCFVEMGSCGVPNTPGAVEDSYLPCGTIMHPAAFRAWNDRVNGELKNSRSKTGEDRTARVSANLFCQSNGHLRCVPLSYTLPASDADRTAEAAIAETAGKETGLDIRKAGADFTEASRKTDKEGVLYIPKDPGAGQRCAAREKQSRPTDDRTAAGIKESEMQRIMRENGDKKHSVSAAKGDKHH